MTHRLQAPGRPTTRRARWVAPVAAAVLLAACGGGGDEPLPACPTGFTTEAATPAGYHMAVCASTSGVAQAYGVFDYAATVAAAGSDGYTLTLSTPGYAMPSPVTLDTLQPARLNAFGGLGVYAVDKAFASGTLAGDYFVYSLARQPRAASGFSAAATLMPVDHVDYGLWETQVDDSATPRLFGRYGGGWYLAKAPSAAPAAPTTYRGLVFLRYVERNTGTYAAQLITGVTFNGATLAGSADDLTYTNPQPTAGQRLPALAFASTSVGGGGSVSGTFTQAGGATTVAGGRFEGQFSGPDGEEFVARVAVYLPSSSPKVRAVGVMVLKKQPSGG